MVVGGVCDMLLILVVVCDEVMVVVCMFVDVGVCVYVFDDYGECDIFDFVFLNNWFLMYLGGYVVLYLMYSLNCCCEWWVDVIEMLKVEYCV